MSHTIELRNVSKYYAGEDAVSMGISRVNLELDIGEFVVITGESGSGKSTLLNVISGLDTYEDGEMFVCGEDTTAYGTDEYENYRKTYIGNIFQDFNLINSYTVYQNIEIAMLLAGKDKTECRQDVERLIAEVDLSEYRNTRVSKLSGGQKQRVAIARALAKNAPVIVADEPTGNLDTASADSVMKTLARISSDKLVVIVTHNYEQAEPYATRKLTMHDGSIIEDKKIIHSNTSESETADQLYDRLKQAVCVQDKSGHGKGVAAAAIGSGNAAAQGQMTKASEMQLGVRNAFNLPAKFILLLIVYLFVSCAVLGQYATIKSSMHETDKLGTNPYFANTNSDRIIVEKADESSFTDRDLSEIKKIPNIKDIVKNDCAIDSGVSLQLDNLNIEGPLVSSELINENDITYGHMPVNDHEIVIRVDASTDAYLSMAGDGGKYIGMPVVIRDIDQTQAYDFDREITVAGIILDEDIEKDSGYSLYGFSTVYAGEPVCNEILFSMLATASETELDFNGEISKVDYERAVYSSPKVPAGKVYLFDDQKYYYEDEKAVGKNFSLKIDNRFFESEGNYTVDEVLTKENIQKLLGIPEENYDSYFGCVFINSNDFRELFDKGIYQISVFMINEQESDATQQALNESGFTTLMIKDTLSDPAGDLGKMLDLLAYARLGLELIILFFIAYAVIRLIMRSRNPYYSTLRMLGASKRNIVHIVRTELILMMLLTYGVVVIFALLAGNGVLQGIAGNSAEGVVKLINYLSWYDYGILGVLILLMSCLIANGYSGHMFSKSAMKAFREGV